MPGTLRIAVRFLLMTPLLLSLAPAAADAAPALALQSACPPPEPFAASCLAEVVVNRSSDQPIHVTPDTDPVGSAPPQTGSPAAMQEAYDLTSLSATGGSGDTVGIVDAYGDSSAESDLATYRSSFGLPPCTTANGCFRKVDENGGTNYPANPTGGNAGWITETSLDMEAVSAICPNCHILLVEASTASGPDLFTAEATAANLGANQISNSWGASAPRRTRAAGASRPGRTPGAAAAARSPSRRGRRTPGARAARSRTCRPTPIRTPA